MMRQCYYCDQLFDTIEKLHDHLDVHAKTKAEQEEDKRKDKTVKTTKKEPTPAAVLKKVANVSDSTKTLSKEIKSMTKIFSENQKVLGSMKKSIKTISKDASPKRTKRQIIH